MNNKVQFAGWLMLWLACFALALSGGCGSVARKKGPISPRLLGKWECRKGFAGTITLNFKNDNSLDVSETHGDKNSGFTGSWSLEEDKKLKDSSKDELLIQMQTKKGGKSEFRTIKFTSAESFELKRGGEPLGRFEKQK